MVERYMSRLNNLLVIKSMYGVALKGNKTKFLPYLIIWFYCKINCLMGRYFVMYHLMFQGAKVFNWIKTKIFCRNVKMHFLFAWKWESGNFNTWKRQFTCLLESLQQQKRGLFLVPPFTKQKLNLVLWFLGTKEELYREKWKMHRITRKMKNASHLRITIR